MKKNSIIISLFFILLSGVTRAQDLLPDSLLKKNCAIILKENVIQDVQVWKTNESKLEYLENGSLHDIAREDVRRFDFQDYSVIIRSNKLDRIKYYDLMVAANTYTGIKETDSEGKIYFSKKNNASVKSYPSYTKFVDGAVIFSSENVNASVNQNSQNLSTLPSAQDTARVDSSKFVKEDRKVITDKNPFLSPSTKTSNETPGFIDPSTSYTLGQQAALKRFDRNGYAAMSCFASGCLGLYTPALLLIKPDPIRPGVMPANVDARMYEEGYKNKIHELRRKNLVKGTAILMGTSVALTLLLFVALL
jgi:hypothetical protein